MMVVYVPYSAIFTRTPFDGCFGDLPSSTRCNWVVPGTWPDWML